MVPAGGPLVQPRVIPEHQVRSNTQAPLDKVPKPKLLKINKYIKVIRALKDKRAWHAENLVPSLAPHLIP